MEYSDGRLNSSFASMQVCDRVASVPFSMAIGFAMTSEVKEDAQGPYFEQRLSVLVRARLLFKREIEIDRGGAEVNFDNDYLRRVVEKKQSIDMQMYKMLSSSAGATFLLYLIGVGVDPSVPIWGVKLLAIPGVLIFIAFFASYGLAMSGVAFYNSQTYGALIDQVILQNSKDGIIDVDMIKAGHESEWLIFKALRGPFSLYAPVHIEFKGFGRFVNAITFFIVSLIAVTPFILIIFALPYLAIHFLPNDVFGIAAKGFSLLCATSVVLLTVVTNFGFTCIFRLRKDSESEQG